MRTPPLTTNPYGTCLPPPSPPKLSNLVRHGSAVPSSRASRLSSPSHAATPLFARSSSLPLRVLFSHLCPSFWSLLFMDFIFVLLFPALRPAFLRRSSCCSFRLSASLSSLSSRISFSLFLLLFLAVPYGPVPRPPTHVGPVSRPSTSLWNPPTNPYAPRSALTSSAFEGSRLFDWFDWFPHYFASFVSCPLDHITPQVLSIVVTLFVWPLRCMDLCPCPLDPQRSHHYPGPTSSQPSPQPAFQCPSVCLTLAEPSLAYQPVWKLSPSTNPTL